MGWSVIGDRFMIRFLGCVSFVMGLALMALCFLNSDARLHGGHDVSASIYLASYSLASHRDAKAVAV